MFLVIFVHIGWAKILGQHDNWCTGNMKLNVNDNILGHFVHSGYNLSSEQ